MKTKHKIILFFGHFCIRPREYVKLKVELGDQVHRTQTNLFAVSIVKMLRAKATETGSFLNVAITKTITNSFALSRKATP